MRGQRSFSFPSPFKADRTGEAVWAKPVASLHRSFPLPTSHRQREKEVPGCSSVQCQQELSLCWTSWHYHDVGACLCWDVCLAGAAQKLSLPAAPAGSGSGEAAAWEGVWVLLRPGGALAQRFVAGELRGRDAGVSCSGAGTNATSSTPAAAPHAGRRPWWLPEGQLSSSSSSRCDAAVALLLHPALGLHLASSWGWSFLKLGL